MIEFKSEKLRASPRPLLSNWKEGVVIFSDEEDHGKNNREIKNWGLNLAMFNLRFQLKTAVEMANRQLVIRALVSRNSAY